MIHHARPDLPYRRAGEKVLDLVLAVVIENALEELHPFVFKNLGDASLFDFGLDLDFLSGLICLVDLAARAKLVIQEDHYRGNLKICRLDDLKVSEEFRRPLHPLVVAPVMLAVVEALGTEACSDSFADASEETFESLIKF